MKPSRTLNEAKSEIAGSSYPNIAKLIKSWIRVGYGDWQLKLSCCVKDCKRIRRAGFDEIKRGLVSERCNPCDTKNRHRIYRMSRGNEMTRICKRCSGEKTRDLFSIRDQDICDACVTWQARYHHIRRNYKLSVLDFWLLYDQQKSSCPVCGNHLSMFSGLFPSVDHCHETNVVRGLLHRSCNSSLHIFEQNKENFKNAERYLERTTKRTEELLPPSPSLTS